MHYLNSFIPGLTNLAIGNKSLIQQPNLFWETYLRLQYATVSHNVKVDFFPNTYIPWFTCLFLITTN